MRTHIPTLEHITRGLNFSLGSAGSEVYTICGLTKGDFYRSVDDGCTIDEPEDEPTCDKCVFMQLKERE